MGTLSFQKIDKNIYKNGVVVGITDELAPEQNGYFYIPDIVVKGDLSGELEYEGRIMVAEQIETLVGMEVGQFGVRGPIWKNVRCKILK